MLASFTNTDLESEFMVKRTCTKFSTDENRDGDPSADLTLASQQDRVCPTGVIGGLPADGVRTLQARCGHLRKESLDGS